MTVHYLRVLKMHCTNHTPMHAGLTSRVAATFHTSVGHLKWTSTYRSVVLMCRWALTACEVFAVHTVAVHFSEKVKVPLFLLWFIWFSAFLKYLYYLQKILIGVGSCKSAVCVWIESRIESLRFEFIIIIIISVFRKHIKPRNTETQHEQ